MTNRKIIKNLSIVIIAMMIFTMIPGKVKADETNTSVLVSDEISVKGFQIRNNRYDTDEEIKADEEEFGVSFRILGTAPKIGQQITVDSQVYTVKKVGMIYVLDTNQKGNNGTNEYSDEKYSFVDITDYTIGKTGAKIYQGINKGTDNTTIAYGYESTEIGIIDSDSSDTVVYCQTLTKMDKAIANTIHTRAFVVATDSEDNEVIIYGKNINSVSVAEIADYLYVNNACTNAYAHQFLYNKILNGKNGDETATSVLQQAGNPFYRDTQIDFGWNGSIFTPENSEE